MTATDELRRLLDERGVEWDYGITGATTTRFSINGIDLTFTPMRDGLVCSTIITPAQAIAATLGPRTCRLVETEHEQEIAHEFGNGYFTYWSYDCDECGHENTEYGRFCAGCGAKVVGE